MAEAAYHGKAEMDLDRFEDTVDLFGVLSTIHGLAHMVLAEKATHLFEHPTDRDFVEKDLPRVQERIYQSKDASQ